MDVNTGSTETVFDMALFDLHKYMGDGLECETDTDTAIAFSTLTCTRVGFFKWAAAPTSQA